ncbi:MAG TPA: putative hydro-lyase [Pirellulales bacterium]|nr:putative hydro-lyase [Pirellulales bacterium]
MIKTKYRTAAELRQAIRDHAFCEPTAGQALGFVQANVVIVPAKFADDFERFCELNRQACPLIARGQPGVAELPAVAAGADVRTDVPRYRVFRHGVLDGEEPRDLRRLWRDDLTVFLIGCSFTFEAALLRAGLHVRHLEQGSNVSMYRTSRLCQPAGPFGGNLVVSMRPYRRDQIDLVREVTARYPRMHGEPVHFGNPQLLGITDLARPDFGDPVSMAADEIPVFWACGVTPQLALANARLDLAITHSPGYMFVTDLRDDDFCDLKTSAI